MRRYIILTALTLVAAIWTQAATKQEMEQARALVAKWGVRSQNSGSGYLDGTNPKNIEQVRASVKSHKTDNDNLGKLSLAMPAEEDYLSWDKTRMTNYWMTQYNAAVPSGGDKEYCRSKLKAQLASVSATVVEKPHADPAGDPEDGTADGETGEDATEATDSTDMAAGEPLATDVIDAAQADPEVEPVAAPGVNGEREAAQNTHELSDGGSSVWVIVMLVVLVLIVLALVGYATNMMARNNSRQQGNPRRNRGGAAAGNGDGDGDDDDDDDDDDVSAGKRLDEDNRPESSGVWRGSEGSVATRPVAAASVRRQSPRISQPRIIYLSHANAEGVFLRADAQYNMGNSIFKLVTSDGYSGTFSVIDDANVHQLALMMPVDFLVSACAGRNLQLSQGMSRIVTDSTGTAVFEDGRWRVARKAQIHYIR